VLVVVDRGHLRELSGCGKSSMAIC
jgi:hypothetical protein